MGSLLRHAAWPWDQVVWKWTVRPILRLGKMGWLTSISCLLPRYVSSSETHIPWLTSLSQQNAAVRSLLDQVPSVRLLRYIEYIPSHDLLPIQLSDMRAAIDKKRRAGKHRVKLVNLFPAVPPAAWTLVRWFALPIGSMYSRLTGGAGASTHASHISSPSTTRTR
jgi:hypothetical protein